MFQPRLFALAHYATYDGLLTSLWVAGTLSFARAVEPRPNSDSFSPRWLWVGMFGVLAACAMGTKLTGWFLPIPLLAWVILYRDRRGALALVTGLTLSVGVLLLLVPTWWHDPIIGLDRFFRSNLSRAETMRIKTLFLGTIYETPNGSLPWYNTLVWTLMITPVGFLVLAAVGLVATTVPARKDAFGMLFLLNWAFLMVLRSLPHTPGHDGVRQFLPAFGFLALMVGLGAESVRRRLGRAGRSLIVVAILEGAVSIGLMMPVPLSYYSPLVGGLPGAARWAWSRPTTGMLSNRRSSTG